MSVEKCADDENLIKVESDDYDSSISNMLVFRKAALTGVTTSRSYKPHETNKSMKYPTLHIILCGVSHYLYYSENYKLDSDYRNLINLMSNKE